MESLLRTQNDRIEDTFKFHMEANVVKSEDENGKQVMVLEGIASTSDKDRQGENLTQKGLDFEFLKTAGYINWHHQMNKNPEAIIGEPIDVKMKDAGLYVKGKLYEDSDMAQKAYKLAGVLQKNSTTRRLGWSVEGKVTERDPNNPGKVLKARITGVALTPMPINPNTLVSIVKAFEGGDGELMLEEENYEQGFIDIIEKARNSDFVVVEGAKTEA